MLRLRLSIFAISLCLHCYILGLPVRYLYLLRIFHQNDIHSHFAPVQQDTQVCPKTERSSKHCFGGFARAVRFIRKQKNHSDSLNLNTGDFFGGHVSYSLFGPDFAIEMIRHMPYEAIALGHAEFRDGIDKLYSFLMGVGYRFLCTNIHFKLKKRGRTAQMIKLCQKSRVVSVGPQWGGEQKRYTVGLVGFTTPDVKLMANTSEVSFEDEITALKREVRSLTVRRRIKIIVAVGHASRRRNLQIAREVEGLDVLVCGHSHSLLTDGEWQPFYPNVPEGTNDQPRGMYPTVVKQSSGRTVLVLEAYRHGKYMGFIDVGFDYHGEVRDWWPDLRLLDQTYEEDPDVLQVLKKYDDKIEKALPNVLGKTLVELNGRPELCNRAECNMGNLVADAVLWANKQDEVFGQPAVNIALVPARVLHMPQPLPAGSITLKFLTQALSHGHTFSIFHLKGRAVWDALESSASAREDPDGLFLQVAGLQVTINEAMPPGHRLQSVSVLTQCDKCDAPQKQRLDLSANYSVAVADYIADNCANYSMLNRFNDTLSISSLDKYWLDLDMVMKYLKHHTPVQPRLEKRITIETKLGVVVTAGCGGPSPLKLVLLMMVLNRGVVKLMNRLCVS